MSNPDLEAAARRWLAEDPDPVTRTELAGLLDRAVRGEPAAIADLSARFTGRLQFGTAGLRGALGAGPTRMNRVVVQRAAAGLADYLCRQGQQGATVVVGYDARTNSDVFARDSAEVFAGAGLRPVLLTEPAPTPVIAFAIRHLQAAAAVVVTASHNPPQDNGYKVYLGDGSQIVPPADAEIAAAIDAVGPLAAIPRSDVISSPGPGLLMAYRQRLAALLDEVAGSDGAQRRDLRIVYTPMHGVGGRLMVQALTDAGFTAVDVVPEQAEPDPAFPTVAFPNPEEPGALDLALARAAAQNADIVLANDPDADRCAVAVPGPDGWRMLRGDEVGTLLGRRLLVRRPGVFAASIVSSSMLAALAERAGVEFAQTLTGFKWIGRVPNLAFGYEEALGYCVDAAYVADKDGISALLLLADLAATLKAAGRGLLDELDDAAVEVGVHATDQVSVRANDAARIGATMTALRAASPTRLGGAPVQRVDDLTAPSDGLPPTDGLRFVLAGGARVVVRPSGTEPKVKAYLEVIEPVSGRAELALARERAAGRLQRLHADVQAALGG